MWILCMLLLVTCMKHSQQRTSTCGSINCVVEAIDCKVNSNGTQVCNCFVGVSGDACEIDRDECTEHIRTPCGRRGHCVNTFGSYTCNCLRGWAGLTCRSQTTTAPDDFDCFPGWRGKFCMYDIDECTNGSTSCPGPHEYCVNIEGSYNCTCTAGWEGSDCMHDIDECVNSPCIGRKMCQKTPGSYNCTYHVDPVESTGDTVWSTTTVITVSCVSGIVVLVIVIVTIYCIIHFGKARKHRTNPHVNTE